MDLRLPKYLYLIMLLACSLGLRANNSYSVIEQRLLKYNKTQSGYSTEISIDRQNNTVIYKTLFKGYLLSIDSVRSFDDYMARDKRAFIRGQFRKIFNSGTSGASSSGLIGDIDVPVTFGQLGSFLGEGSKLKIEGSERVEFNGSKTIDLNKTETENAGNNWLPELTPFQHLIVNVTGTVGDRIRVNLNHNSQTDRPSDNKVKIEYHGDEDDILQSIEAGDVALSLPGVKLIGAPPQHEGLFGVKGTGQLGPVNFVAIASKETGETNSQSFTGNTKSDTIIRYDTEFARNRFYMLGFSPSDTLIELNLFKDDGNGYNNESQGAVPGMLLSNQAMSDSSIYDGYFTQMQEGESKDFVIGPGNQYIELISALSTPEALGMSYIVKHQDGTYDTVGTVTYTAGDTLKLMGLKIKEDYPGSPTWDYMLKNVYSFNASNIVTESFYLTIKKVNNASGDDYELENGRTYLSILGLDNNNDGVVDYNFINFDRGYIIFPSTTPFASSMLEEPDSEIYNTNETGYDIGRLYYLEIAYRGAQSVYSLGTFNILEGSEVITVNGVQMVKGKDYTIDYEYGIVTFLTDAVNSPTADVRIDYQYTPFLSVVSKNLLGFHMDYNPGDNISLNTNWLYHTLSYQLDDYPRLGEEPSDALVGEMDMNYNEDIPFLTSIFNILPFYQTDMPSKLALSGRAGMSYPNPNSAGKAYIEDMESVLSETSLSSDRKSWYFGSLPQGLDENNLSYDYLWYNDRELLGNINDQLPPQDRSTDVNILKMIMTPDYSDPLSTFTVLNQTLSKTGLDLSDMRFMQLWVKGSGELTVEIGKNIPEDMLRRDGSGLLAGRGVLDTEDANYDGILDADEDTGLDGVSGDDNLAVAGDDGNDDYYYSAEHPNDYSKINGTENNNMLDTEDKNGDLRLNTQSDLHRFRFDLNSGEYLVYEHPSSGWKLFRIPLNDLNVETEGTPDLKYVKTARLTWSGITETDTLNVYQISMVSNKWKDFVTLGSAEEKFYVGAKNNQTDIDYFPPFNPGYDLSGAEKKEQSIVLYMDNLNPGEGGRVHRYLSKRENYERYRTISFYARSTVSDSLELFIRFGGDSLNYYSMRYYPGTDWAYVELPLESLVNLKRDSDTTQIQSGMFGFRGSPSLTNVKYIEFTVYNRSLNNYTGEVWIDDIMLLEPKREIGIAGDISGSFSVPSLLNVTGTVSYRDPFFHRLTDERGSGNYSKNYNISAGLTADKLFPEIAGISMPLNYSYSSGVSEPLYKSGSDYYLSEDEILENLSTSRTQSFNASLGRNRKSANALVKYTLDNLRLNGSFSKTSRNTYNKIDTTGTYSGNMSYTLASNIKPRRLLNRMNVYIMPSNLSYTLGYSSRWSTIYTKGADGFINTGMTQNENISRNFSINYKIVPSLSLNYREGRTNDPQFEGSGYTSFLGRDIGKSMTVSSNYNPKFVRFLTHTLSFSSNYQDASNIRSITVLDSSRITNISNSGRISVNGNVDYPFILRWISQLRDETKDASLITASPPWLLMKLEDIGSMFSPLNYSYSHNKSSKYSYVLSRADLLYQTGITDTIPSFWYSDYTQPNRSVSQSYSLSTGVNLYNLSLNSSYSYSYSRSGYLSNVNENINTRWPNLSGSLNNVQEFFNLSKFFRSITIRSSYSVSESKSGKPGEDYSRISYANNMTPLAGVSIMMKNSMNIDYSYSMTGTNTYSFSSIETQRENTNKNHNLSIAYSFNAPSGINIPLLNKKVKFRSNVNLKVDMSYSQTLEIDVTNNNILQDRIIYSVSPRADYNFSNNVTGGINASFSKTSDRKRGDERVNVSAGIWVLFRF